MELKEIHKLMDQASQALGEHLGVPQKDPPEGPLADAKNALDTAIQELDGVIEHLAEVGEDEESAA